MEIDTQQRFDIETNSTRVVYRLLSCDAAEKRQLVERFGAPTTPTDLCEPEKYKWWIWELPATEFSVLVVRNDNKCSVNL